jgi:xanthine dehydrogenase accessory factor
VNHLSAILNAYQNRLETDRPSFLATVVQTKGSTYRQVGARMLIVDENNTAGMISGGCLEHDIICHVQQQIPPYHPFVITYDTTTEADILWGFGLGCNGVVQVLVEPLELSCNQLSFIAECFARHQPGMIATIVQADHTASVGERLLLHSDGSVESNVKDSVLSRTILEEARSMLFQAKTGHLQIGQLEVLLEVIQPPPSLILFGAGQDALPLAQFAKALGWHLTVVDCRSQTATYDRFSIADRIILTRRSVLEQIQITSTEIVVIMTHNYEDDQAILPLVCSAQYVGLLGSRQRAQRLQQAVGHYDQLHAPIGLDIGAETPEEIAIAIIAEIQAVLRDRTAGLLKHRQTPIHLVTATPHSLYA